MRTIQTDRLRLEPVSAANAPALWEVLQEPDLRSYQDLPDVGVAEFLRAVSARPRHLGRGASGRFEWLIHLKGAADAPPLGWVSLRIAERTTSTAEVGYSIVRAYRDRGFATEAVSALVDESFRNAGLRRIRAYCVPENQSSRAVLRRIGFEDDGVLPHGATVQGHPVDVIAHVLERSRWEALLSHNRSAIGS